MGKMISCMIFFIIFFCTSVQAQISRTSLQQGIGRVMREQHQWQQQQLPQQFYYRGSYTYALPRYNQTGAALFYVKDAKGGLLRWQPSTGFQLPAAPVPATAYPLLKKKPSELSPLLKKLLYDGSKPVQ